MGEAAWRTPLVRTSTADAAFLKPGGGPRWPGFLVPLPHYLLLTLTSGPSGVMYQLPEALRAGTLPHVRVHV